jgi:hypothetical protein
MGIGDRPIAVDVVETRRTVNRLGGEIARAIERQQIVAVKERHRFQCLATLELAKDAREHRAEQPGGDWIKDFAPVRVARDPRNAVDGVHIALRSLLVKGQERGRFEGKHGKGRHERIGSGNLDIAHTVIGKAGKTAVHQAKERISGQMLTSLRRNDGHGQPHHENLKSFKSGGIFASMFTKGQVNRHGDH